MSFHSGVRDNAPAGNAFWRILKATERYFCSYRLMFWVRRKAFGDKTEIWGGAIAGPLPQPRLTLALHNYTRFDFHLHQHFTTYTVCTIQYYISVYRILVLYALYRKVSRHRLVGKIVRNFTSPTTCYQVVLMAAPDRAGRLTPISPPPKMSLSPHRETYWSRISRWIVRNVQLWIVSACSQNL